MNQIIKLLLLGWALSLPLSAAEIRAVYADAGSEFFTHPDPFEANWHKMKAVEVDLYPQNMENPKIFKAGVSKVKVKAVHNKKWLAIYLSWPDDTKNNQVATSMASDAAAIQIPVMSWNKTSFIMGGPKTPVSIMNWKAIWQNDIDTHYQETQDVFPNTWVDTYQFGKNPAIDVNNPVSQPNRKEPVESLMAEGFGTLTSQKHQNLHGKGVYKDGRWHVVFARPFVKANLTEAELRMGKKTALAFAIWDGGNGETGSRKAYAPWNTLWLELK